MWADNFIGYGPLAQLDRALRYGRKGQGFESLTVRQKKTCSLEQVFFCCITQKKGVERVGSRKFTQKFRVYAV